MDKYIIYGIEKCPYCLRARKFLGRRGVEVVWIDLSTDPDYLNEVKEYHNFPTVPIILKNNPVSGLVSFIGGYSDLLETLDV